MGNLNSFSTSTKDSLLVLPDDQIAGLSNATDEVVEGQPDDSGDGESASSGKKRIDEGPIVIKARAYQTEMVEESLRRNIIVAMDTGSGKTHIAVMRMQHELERMAANQLIWFLAPTVSLCSQQFETIEAQISSVQVKFLSGADEVDRWTEQSLWDAILKNVKIVVSPYQILYDALTHGFVKMESLALIVFDEAHNCVSKNPGAMLMRNGYHPRKAKGLSVPHILGLTASPVMRTNPNSIVSIEDTLDAICRSPTKHRAELRLQVKLPVMAQVYYQDFWTDTELSTHTKTIRSLGQAYGNLNIWEDPYIIQLQKQNSERSQRELDKRLVDHKTYSQKQIKSFHATTLKICKELGAWAAHYYVSQVVSNVFRLAEEVNDNVEIWDVATAEKKYISKALKQVDLALDTEDAIVVTDKVDKLIDVLLQADTGFRGIIFVQERAVVSVLSHLLSVHPKTRNHFKIATMVGTSVNSFRAHNLGELIDLKAQNDTLAKFRSGEFNLVIATSVLEEGIDVPECNVVLCFQKPANLKSFVQRRGRARQRDSKLILLLDTPKNKLDEFQQAEMEMRRVYENDMRVLQQELIDEDNEEHHEEPFIIPSTGARLDLDNAVAHLYHFCAVLPQREYVDLRPEFICTKDSVGLIRARVILPLSAGEAVRHAESKKIWKSERNAIKDAAFQAYIALYHAGLVNNNLLPLLGQDKVADELTATAIETRASIVSANEQLNPWVEIAKMSTANQQMDFHQSTITVGDLEVDMILPMVIPQLPPFNLYWDSKTELLVTIDKSSHLVDPRSLLLASKHTSGLLQAVFGHRFVIKREGHVLPVSIKDQNHALEAFLCSQTTTVQNPQSDLEGRILRDKLDRNIGYVYEGIIPNKPPIEQVQHPYSDYLSTPNSPHLCVRRLPKRHEYLSRTTDSGPLTTKIYSAVLPLERCTVDTLPAKVIQFGLLLPSIFRRLEIYLVAQALQNNILRGIDIPDFSLVVTAIMSASAQESADYQRLEFLGDSTLKLCTAIQLMAIFPLWHEGYLSKMKDRLVANSRLSRAAIEIGLDKYIINTAFNGHKWRPLYTNDLLKQPTNKTREISTKVLADVVESLVGVSTISGGIPLALKTLQVFLPEIAWLPLEDRQEFLFSRAQSTPTIPPATLLPLQTRLNYKFKKPSLLLEAITHCSACTGAASLERLEYLGDSILDHIITKTLWAQSPPLSHFQMHLLRTAMVNADFLAYVSMTYFIPQETTTLPPNPSANSKTKPPTPRTTTLQIPLYKFLHHTNPQLSSIQKLTAQRFQNLHPALSLAIQEGQKYPWALLSQLDAKKFYSDMIESLIGALWVDSGSLSTCESFIRDLGIIPYLETLVKNKARVWHPKEELGVLADTEKVKYIVELEKKGDVEKNGGGGRKGGYSCRIFVGGKEVCGVEGGVSRLEVRTKAADLAVEILRGEKKGGGKGDGGDGSLGGDVEMVDG